VGCPAPACPPAHPLPRAQPVHRHTNVGERPMLARARQVTPSARSPRATQPARGRAPAAHTVPCSGCSAGAPLPLAAAPRAAGPSLSRHKRTPPPLSDEMRAVPADFAPPPRAAPSRCVLHHRGRARRARPLGRSPDSGSDARHALVLNPGGVRPRPEKRCFLLTTPETPFCVPCELTSHRSRHVPGRALWCALCGARSILCRRERYTVCRRERGRAGACGRAPDDKLRGGDGSPVGCGGRGRSEAAAAAVVTTIAGTRAPAPASASCSRNSWHLCRLPAEDRWGMLGAAARSKPAEGLHPHPCFAPLFLPARSFLHTHV